MKDTIQSLVIRAKQNDAMAHRALYERSVRQMYNMAYRLTNNRFDAQDVLQEAYAVAFTKLDTLKDNAYFFGWLKRIVINKSLAICRSRMHFQEVDALELPQVEEEGYAEIPIQELHAAIQELPNGCREVFSLYLLEGLKHREIAGLLDISLPTSKSQYRYALKLLRHRLKKYRE